MGVLVVSTFAEHLDFASPSVGSLTSWAFHCDTGKSQSHHLHGILAYNTFSESTEEANTQVHSFSNHRSSSERKTTVRERHLKDICMDIRSQGYECIHYVNMYMLMWKSIYTHV